MKAIVHVNESSGFHARPATVFVQRATQFACAVAVCAHGRTANGKSLLNLIALGAKSGDELTIETSGDDEAKALKALVELFN